MRYRVAGLDFELITAYSDKLHRQLANYKPFEVSECKEAALFTLSLDNEPEFTGATLDKVMDYELSGGFATIGIYGGMYILQIRDSRTERTYTLECNAIGEGNHNYRCDFLAYGKIPPLYILDHFLVFAFSLAALDREALIIHASTVIYDDRAVLCLGESGTGKSTHTRLWCENIEGSHLLNDDGPVVRYVDGKLKAYGSPWSGKTPCYRNEEYPVKAFIRIRRAGFNEMEKLAKLKGFGALLPSCIPTLPLRESELDKVCAILSRIVSDTPVYALDCLPDADAALTSFSELFS